LRQNPGLKPLVSEILADAYCSALAVAERDTGIEEKDFTDTAPWDFEQIMNEGFWPK